MTSVTSNALTIGERSRPCESTDRLSGTAAEKGSWTHRYELAPNLDAFAVALQRLRCDRTLTVKQAAQRGGFSLASITHVARGRMPRLSTVVRFAIGLDVSTESLATTFALPFGTRLDAVLETNYSGTTLDEPWDARTRRFSRTAAALRGAQTQAEVAARSGFHATIVGALERARTPDPTLGTTWRLALALRPDTSLDALHLLVGAFAGEREDKALRPRLRGTVQ